MGQMDHSISDLFLGMTPKEIWTADLRFDFAPLSDRPARNETTYV